MIPLGTLGSARVAPSGGGLAAAIAALSPVGYWKLDETSGTTATDSSGNGRHGTYSGTYTLAGQNGFALFGGGHVAVPDDNAFTAIGSTSGFSVFSLARLNTGNTGRQFPYSKGDGGGYEWALEAKDPSTGGVIEANVWTAAGGEYMKSTTPASTLPAATWSAVTMALPMPGPGATVSIYLGGTKVSGTGLNNGAGGANGTAAVRLAGRADGAGPWLGGLAHVAIFRTELTQAQVDGLVNAATSEGLI